MAHKLAWLTKRVKLDGKWCTKPPVFAPTGMLTGKVKVGNEKRIVPGIFVLEWYEQGKRQRRVIGGDIQTAFKEFNHQIRLLADKAEGREVIEDPESKRHALEIAINEYVEHLEAKERVPKTINGVRQVLEFMQKSTGRVYLEQLKPNDITQKFASALRADGYAKQTMFDRFAKVVSFLKWCEKQYGVKRVVELKDGPVRPRARNDEDGGKKDPYTEQELSKLFAASTPEERLIWSFLLHTGCREMEAMNATWRDIDLESRVFHIRCDEEFRTKDRSNRSVPYPQELADALRPRKEKSTDRLVFPGNDGKVERHTIRKLKARALAAGLNCGLCVTSKNESCRNKPVCENWYLHRFRHTFACMHLRKDTDVRTVQQWLGHSDLATTSIYLTKIKNSSRETQQMVDAVFAGVQTGLQTKELRIQ